ncbi:unnamed protein product, partial [Brachionus calyciflorus]
LTTWWDVYETLMHVFHDQNNISDHPSQSKYLIESQKIKSTRNGESLFTVIPNRSCKQAKIPDYLCVCNYNLNIEQNNKKIKEGATFMIDHINNQLLKNYSDICMKLSLKKIIEVQSYTNYPGKYTIVLVTLPNEAVFDGTIILKEDKGTNVSYVILGKIIRINSYGITSNCMNKYSLRNYCYCRDYHDKISKKN